jgi:triosephosphate isomerase
VLKKHLEVGARADAARRTARRVTVAYEPGGPSASARIATLDQIAAAHTTIRKWLEQKLGHDSAETMRIL